MSNFDIEELSQKYYDVLKEIGNIGAGNATTALAQLLQTKVDMQVPQVKLLNFKHLGDTLGGAEQIMTGIYMTVDGDITGSIMFLIEQKAAKHLVGKMMGSQSEGLHFTQMEESCMKEVSNIITGSYLNSLSKLTNLTICPSIPYMATDMAGAILSVPAVEFGQIGDEILLIQTQFSDDINIDGFFIMIPDLASYERILGALGINLEGSEEK